MDDNEVEEAMRREISVQTSVGGKTYTGLVARRIRDGWLFKGIKGSEEVVASVRYSSSIFPVEEK